jgi:hypothetical protein
MRCEVDGMWIFDANRDGHAASHHGSAYAIYSVNGPDGSTYGNVHIRNSFARGATAVRAVAQLISGEDASVMKDVDVEIDSDSPASRRASRGLGRSQLAGVNRVEFKDGHSR